MAIFAGSDKLENRTMAQNSLFIIGKNRLEYRDKQKRLVVLVRKFVKEKKKSTKKTIQTRKKCIFTESTIKNNNNKRNNIREDNFDTINFKWHQKSL